MTSRSITKENIAFDFDNILQTFYPEKSWSLLGPRPSLNSDLPKKAPRLGVRSRKIIKGDQKLLGLPQISSSPAGSKEIIIRHESPWDTYRRIGVSDVGGQVIIAADVSRSSRKRAIREYTRADTERLIHYFRNSDNRNVLCARECYIYQLSMYALVDHLPLTLNDLVRCRTLYPTEAELASIVSQVCFLR
jgi:hypothetical protein